MTEPEIALASLQRRIRGMHTVWREAMESMDQDHVNHFERAGVLPIAFSVHHMTMIEDSVANRMFQAQPTVWEQGGWAERVGITIDDHGKELTVAEMEHQRIGDWDAYRDYQAEVFAGTEAWLDGLDATRLTDVLFGGIVPPVFQNAYVARVVGDGPITVLDGIECWIFQHGIRHLGETEHARALVGLGGITS
jgi:hypothetical protein